MKLVFRRLCHAEEGQILVFYALVLVILVGFSALVVDVGYLFHAQTELQASTNAAASAGALAMSCTTTGGSTPPCNLSPTATATAYSGGSGDKNAAGDLSGVTMASGYPQLKCLQTMENLGLSCTNTWNANAIMVKQQVTVSLFFARIFKFSSLTLTATALAAMKGGTPLPANITIIMDTTASMNQADSHNESGNNVSQCEAATGLSNPTSLDCAKWGVRTLLKIFDPCAANLTSCGSVSQGNVANPVQEVGLLTFPGLVSASDAQYDYQNCGNNMSRNYLTAYAGPNTQPPYFTIVQPSSDYRTSDSSGLNGASSPLVQAVDWQDGNSCSSSQYGLQAIGGYGTYYAGIIQEASNDLPTSGTRGSMQNAIILLSDGDANATSSDFTSAALKANPSIDKNECQQAVTQANAAAKVKNAVGVDTWVFSIAFGSSTSASNSCSTDNGAISACTTMQDIASDPSKFYSDDGNGCVSPDNPNFTSLSEIFQNIGYDFLSTRLLPPNTQ